MKRDILTNMGALAIGFVFTKFVKQHSLLMVKFAHLCKLKLADDNLAPMVTYYVQLHFWLKKHYDELWYFIIILGKFDLILGMPWLEQQDPKVFFYIRMLIFNFDYCTAHCLS